MLERWVQARTAPAPRAAPPTTIGPFANVPAPGSPIRSDWTQQITHYVVDWNSGASAPKGAVVWIETAAIPDVSSGVIGVRDIATFLNGRTFPFPTQVLVHVSGLGGFSAGTASWAFDLQNLISGAVFGINSQIVQTPGGIWAAHSVDAAWTVPANGATAWKVRQNVTNNGGGVVHVSGTVSSLIIAT
jgi:hypothetical protein